MIHVQFQECNSSTISSTYLASILIRRAQDQNHGQWLVTQKLMAKDTTDLCLGFTHPKFCHHVFFSTSTLNILTWYVIFSLSGFFTGAGTAKPSLALQSVQQTSAASQSVWVYAWCLAVQWPQLMGWSQGVADNSSLEFLHSLLDCVVVVVVVVAAVVLVSGRIYDFMWFVQQRSWFFPPGYRRCSIEGWNATEIDEEPGDAWWTAGQTASPPGNESCCLFPNAFLICLVAHGDTFQKTTTSILRKTDSCF